MMAARRSFATFFALLFSFNIIYAQQGSTPSRQSPTPTVTATASNERVRYVSLGEVHHTRLQVFSIDGAQVFDSTFRLGNLIDWRLTDQQGSHIQNGAYLYLITIKDFADRLTQKYGTVVLEQQQVSLEQTILDALPQPLVNALDSNRQADVLSAVDRIGAAGLDRTDTTASPSGNSTSGAQPSRVTEPTGMTGGENIAGTGTRNRIAKWTDSSATLGDAALTEIGGRLGIGTTNPNYEITLSGSDVGVQMVSPSTGTTASDGFRFGISSTNNAFLWNQEATDMYFGTSATERLRITSGGNVGIGTANPLRAVQIGSSINAAFTLEQGTTPDAGFIRFGDQTGWKLHIGRNREVSLGPLNSGTSGVLMTILDNGRVGIGTTSPSALLQVAGHTDVASLFVSGSLSVFVDNQPTQANPLCISNANYRVGYCSSSSLRYKKDLTRFVGGLALIDRLRPVRFTWKRNGEHDIGLAAEEVAEVEPLLTFRNGKGEIEGVRYNQLSALFINAFKEQQSQLQRQQRLIEQLRSQFLRQQAQLNQLKRTLRRKRAHIK